MSQNPARGRWRVLALTILAQALIIGIQSFSFSFWMVPWLDEFKASRSELMLAITACTLAVAALSPFAGAALDRFPTRLLFCFGVISFALGLWLISIAHSHWIIVVIYGAVLPVGVTFAGSMAGQVLVARAFSENRGFALGLSALGVSIGAFVVPPLTTALLEACGWRGAFQWFAGATLLLLLPPAWWVLGGFDAAERSAGPPHGETAIKTADLLRSPAFWIVALAFCAMLSPYIPLMHNLGAYARDRGIGQQTAAVIASVGAVSLALGKVGFGKLADIYDARRLYWFAMSVMVLGVVVASFATSVVSLAAGFALTTFAGGSFLPLTGKIIADRFGAAFGRAMGLAMLFSTGASALSPLVVATIRDANGSYTVAFLSMLAVVPPALIAMRWLSPRAAPAG